jgi:hypothetical protein
MHERVDGYPLNHWLGQQAALGGGARPPYGDTPFAAGIEQWAVGRGLAGLHPVAGRSLQIGGVELGA